MLPIRVFVSSRQIEFEEERKAIGDFIRNNPFIKRYFAVFLFEDAPASDHRPDELYLDEVERCDVYLGLFGQQYGHQNKDGVSPTEQEFDLATVRSKYRLIFVKNVQERHPLMAKLISKAKKDVVRKKFDTVDDLIQEVSESLTKYFDDHLFSCQNTIGGEMCRTSAEAEELLQAYKSVFQRKHSRHDKLVHFNCQSDEGLTSTRDVISSLTKENKNTIIYGPSGCGKTLIATIVALECDRTEGVAIILPAKSYRGKLMDTIDQDAHLMDFSSATKLLSAAQTVDSPILVVVDGYNESDEVFRELLTIELSAFVRRYRCNLLITSQIPLVRSDFLNLRRIDVSLVAAETKISIAKNVMELDSIPKDTTALLDAVSSGLEAKLVGEVGLHLKPGVSRFTLFDTYVRRHLGNDASDGITFLSHVAGWLNGRLTFSISIRDLDRLVNEKNLSVMALERLKDVGLLSSHGDRISFAHEMFFDAFSAEAVVRSSHGFSSAIQKELGTPLHAGRRGFIIGAIDDSCLLKQVLDGLTDSKTLVECHTGFCGHIAEDWARARFNELIPKIENEARQIRFCLSDHESRKVTYDRACLANWSKVEQALIGAIPSLITHGYYLDEVLSIVSIVDSRIEEEAIRLSPEVRKQKIHDLMFAVSFTSGYWESETTPAISRISHSLQSGFYRSDDDVLVMQIHNRFKDQLSNGQLYLLLKLISGANSTGKLAQFLIHKLKLDWNRVPYNLALLMIDTAGMCFPCSETSRTALVQTIESLQEPHNVFLSSAIVDALKNLGAFEENEIEHRPHVRKQIVECLSHPNKKESFTEAYRIYACKFEHPYNSAYYDVFSNLPVHERKQLLMMAVKGAEYGSAFLNVLLGEITSYKDPDLGGCLTKFTQIPPSDGMFPQDDMGAFVVSHITLATLGAPLPTKYDVAGIPHFKCIRACGTILYWINRDDLDIHSKQGFCRDEFDVLENHVFDGSISALYKCDPQYSNWKVYFSNPSVERLSIVDFFPDEVCNLCRVTLNYNLPELNTNNDFFFSYELSSFVIGILAKHGKISDIPLLRKQSDDPSIGTYAIKAIKELEGRIVGV